ncbi:hypothetical protein RHGRI_005696 [Rhododendron griersonianum]|uniref:FBD domain-containing protein n=1 Tax=Rhododendron griersonianum TaxID=479676 RepID=A0AAV6LFU2_9ERIC|nr:hypothetical protein RHGRI_005696 [Rhododendron griersonianum]
MEVAGGDRTSGDGRWWSPESDGAPARFVGDWVSSEMAGKGRDDVGTLVLKLPETVPTTFTNIRELVLTIFPFDDEDKLCWSNYILKNFPLLYKLQLNLFCANFIKQPKKIKRVLHNCPHYHLTELEINGFYGNHHEQVLLKYLLDNLVELKVLAVSPCQKVYKGFNSWLYEEANSWYKVRMESVCEWLDAVVPPTVRLEVW